MEPRQQRPTLTKHAQASTDCMSTPPRGAPFSLVFPRPEKYHQKVNIIAPICEHGCKMAPKVPLRVPQRDQNPTKILTKSSLSRRGLPPAISDLPKGGTPQNIPKIHRNLSEILWIFDTVEIVVFTPKTFFKKCGRSSLLF